MDELLYTERSMPTFASWKLKAEEVLEKTETEFQLGQAMTLADMYMSQYHLDMFSAGNLIEREPAEMEAIQDPSRIRLHQIAKIVYDPKEQINDKFISVYSSLHNLNSAVALIIRSDGENYYFYIAVRDEDDPGLAGDTVCSVLRGSFPGIDILSGNSGDDKKQFLDSLSSSGSVPKSLATVSLIPSERDEDKKEFVQGMEKFMASMAGKEFTAVLLAVPVDNAALAMRKHGYGELYSLLSPHSKISMSFAHNVTDSVNKSVSKSITTSVNHSISNSNGTNTSNSYGTNSGSNSGFGFGSDGISSNSGYSSGSFSSFTSGSSFTKAVTEGTTESDGQTIGDGKTRAVGETDTTTLNFENKSVSTLLTKIDSQLKRIEFSETYGMWDFCAYFFSNDIAATTQAANVYKSIMLGQESSVERAHINTWNTTKQSEIQEILEHVKHLVHPVAEIPSYEQGISQLVTPTNMVNGKELPIVLGFPRKSVPGMAVVEMAEFGRAVVYENIDKVKRFMNFGHIYHMGITESLTVPMDVDLLASHCFITGSSGSGKSYATYQLLDNLLEQNIHMMVIEPAKGEYKQLFGGLKDIKIYTTDPNVYKLLRINPFQFPDNLHVLNHIEKLIQIFNASWALYAAMPALLKDAVVKAYVKCGWDVMNSIWIEGISDHKYPVFQDVLDILPELINKSDYSADSKGDYKGALLTRVESMTNGIAGLLFERSEGISDKVLFDSNVIVDLSDIGSNETIALIMGVLIMKLGEYRQSMRKAGIVQGRDSDLCHVTVLEEAHNILKRTNKDQSQEGSNIVGQSVEMISNSIKEMRSYGEGFIIIDQSPMAVDSSAIENTSTKIIMNTPAKDACEEVSSALSLSEEQAKELSRLPVGVAATFQKGWLTPVLMKVDMWQNTHEAVLKKADPEEMSIVRGKLIMDLYHQVQENLFSMRSMKSIIRKSMLDEDKKSDLNEIIDVMGSMMGESTAGLSMEEVGKLILMITSCEGLLTVLEDEAIYSPDYIDYKTEKDPDWFSEERKNKIVARCEKWYQKFIKAFRKYAFLEDIDVLRFVIQAILCAKTDNGYDMEQGYTLILAFLAKGII